MNKFRSIFSKKRDNGFKEAKPVEKHVRNSEQDDEYDPLEHRSKSHQLSYFEAAMVLVKGTLGPGIIAMPYAFNLCGYVPAFLTLLIYPILFVFCTHLLVNGMHLLCKQHHVPILSYADAMRLALRGGPPVLQLFSKPSVIFIDVLLVVYHFCVAVIYVITIATLVQNVIDDLIVSLDSRLLMVFLILPLIPIFTIKSLKHMVPMWTLANVLIIFSIIILFVYVLTNLQQSSQTTPFQSPRSYAEGFGFFLFTLQSMGTLLPIEAKMKNPKAFLGWKGLLVTVHISIVLLCIVFGFLGCWRYDIDVEENIIMNISDKDIVAHLVRLFYATALYLSYPLQASVVITNVWYHWLARQVVERDRQPLEFVMRIIVVLLTAILAVCLVNLTAIVPLTGSICITTLGIVFPALLNICIRYNYGFGKLKWMLLRDVFLMVMGIAAGIVGAVASIRVIFVEMRLF